MRRAFALSVSLIFCLPQICFARQAPANAAPPQIESQSVPPAASGAMHLDISVTDKSGNAIAGLQTGDFVLLDNGHPVPIVAFRPHAAETLPEIQSPVQIILVIDSMDDNFLDVAYERAQVQKFLRMNGGHLEYPVSVDWVTENGVKAQNDPTLDGNALADALTDVESRLRSTVPSQGVDGDVVRFRIATRILSVLANEQREKPGRKLLIWVGAGWPMLGGPQYLISRQDNGRVFSGIIDMSDLLRRARISLFSVSQGQADQSTFFYKEFLNGVHHPEDATLADMSLKVLSVQTGGLVEMPTNDMAGAIAACVRGAGTFYTLTFNPPAARSANEFHKLEVRIANRHGLTVRTTTGYYGQPPDPLQQQAQDHAPTP